MFSNKLSIDLSKRSRPSSRIRLLPEIVQTPKNNYGKNSEKINNSLTQRGLEIVQSQKLSLIDNSMGLNQFATQRNSEQAKKELIREIFKQERFQQNKSSLKQDNQLRQSYLVKFEEKVEDLQPKSIMKSESILKRKSSNSREHTDILDFFEMSEVDLRQQRQNHTKKVSLQPLNIQQFNDGSVSPKKVSFNKQIFVKMIDNELKEPQPHRRIIKPINTDLAKRHYSIQDLQD